MNKIKIVLGIILFYFMTLTGCFINNNTESSNNLPTVNLTTNPNSGTEPLMVQLTANANDSDGSIVKFEWDFDGNGIYDRSTSYNTTNYQYSISGTYTPKVMVTDNAGAIAEATTQVIVNATPPVTTGDTTVSTGSFNWTENSSATVQTATTATFSMQYKTLMALNGTTLLFEINLDGTVPATYALGVTNAITYTNVTPYFIATTGNVIITANVNGKMSGTFQGTGTTTGGITSVAGTFTDITVVP